MLSERSWAESPPGVRVLPGRAYRVRTEWRGDSYLVEVSFSPRLAAIMAAAGARCDLDRAEILHPDGRREDLLGCRAEIESSLGAPAPAWVFRWPFGHRPFVLPRDRLELDWDEEARAVAFMAPATCVPIFTCLDAPYLGTTPTLPAAGYLPLAPEAWRPRREELMPGVTVVAPNLGAVRLAALAFEDVCGAAARRWQQDRRGLCDSLAVADELTRDVLERLGGGPPLLPDAQQRLARLIPDVQDADAAAVLAALKRLQKRLVGRLMPVELVVVPSGKHFSALPEMSPIRDTLLAAPSACDAQGVGFSGAVPYTSATVALEGMRYVFLPEDDLLRMQISSRHELYHLLEEQLVDDSVRCRLDALHGVTVARSGPFPRPYGYLRQEYLATMGEVFEGAYGSAGLAWLKGCHQEVEALLREVTARGASTARRQGTHR